jgi:hypothetical protein
LAKRKKSCRNLILSTPRQFFVIIQMTEAWKPYRDLLMKASTEAVICTTEGVVCTKSDSISQDSIVSRCLYDILMSQEYWLKIIKTIDEIGIYNKEEDIRPTYYWEKKKQPARAPLVIPKSDNRDPFTMLPSEICLEVASFVEFTSISAATRVCKESSQIHLIYIRQTMACNLPRQQGNSFDSFLN